MTNYDDYSKLREIIWEKGSTEPYKSSLQMTRNMPIKGNEDVYNLGNKKLEVVYVETEAPYVILSLKEKGEENMEFRKILSYLEDGRWAVRSEKGLFEAHFLGSILSDMFRYLTDKNN